MLRVLILYMSGGTHSCKSTPNVNFLRNSSWKFDLLSEFLSEICLEEVAEEKYSYILSMSDLGFELPTRLRRLLAADNAIFKNRAQNIECSFGCVASHIA